MVQTSIQVYNKEKYVNLECNGPRNLDKEKKMVEEYGFHCHLVPNGDDDSPTGVNFHTHGIPETCDHLDIQVVVFLPPEVFGPIIHDVYKRIKSGTKFEIDTAYDKILKGMNVQFIYAEECGRDVLRMILPDNTGETMPELMKDENFKKQWEGTYREPRTGKLCQK